MNQLVPVNASTAVGSTVAGIFVPTIIADAGEHAARRFLDRLGFFIFPIPEAPVHQG